MTFSLFCLFSVPHGKRSTCRESKLNPDCATFSLSISYYVAHLQVSYWFYHAWFMSKVSVIGRFLYLFRNFWKLRIFFNPKRLSKCIFTWVFFNRFWQVPYFWAGIKTYDVIAGKQLLKPSYYLSKRKALELFPMLKKEKLVGALVYYDGTLLYKLLYILKLTFKMFSNGYINWIEILLRNW